tara:strand:- start:63441 stop:63689 length:249 start_codon:yes stop_codon:yes gene_type:complete
VPKQPFGHTTIWLCGVFASCVFVRQNPIGFIVPKTNLPHQFQTRRAGFEICWGNEKSSQLGFLKDEKRKATDNGWRQNWIKN